MAVLIDTNFFVAVVSQKDINHTIARQAMRNITEKRIVVAPVLPEMFYLVTKRVGYQAAVTLFKLLTSTAFQIEPLNASDMLRMQEIMERYADNRFDFVDTAIMAVSERFQIAEVYTFDHRDFSSFRPKHRAKLRLLP